MTDPPSEAAGEDEDQSDPGHAPLGSIWFDSLSYCVRATKRQQRLHPGAHAHLVLDQVFGSIEPGHLVCLVGPSGAGKTTLLSLLTRRRKRTSRVSGAYAVDGHEVGRWIRPVLSFVDQEDILVPTETVREAVGVAADLRIPHETSTPESRSADADKILKDLAMSQAANAIVGGDAGESSVKSRLSGGERKRLAVATQAVSAPQFLVFDEPTSGLDAAVAYRLVLMLRRITATEAAGTGSQRAVVASLHQPSTEMLSLCTDLFVLAAGVVCYIGPVDNVEDFIRARGLGERPARVTPADWMVDMLSPEPRLARYPGSAAERRLRCTRAAYRLWIDSGQRCPTSGLTADEQAGAVHPDDSAPWTSDDPPENIFVRSAQSASLSLAQARQAASQPATQGLVGESVAMVSAEPSTENLVRRFLMPWRPRARLAPSVGTSSAPRFILPLRRTSLVPTLAYVAKGLSTGQTDLPADESAPLSDAVAAARTSDLLHAAEAVLAPLVSSPVLEEFSYAANAPVHGSVVAAMPMPLRGHAPADDSVLANADDALLDEVEREGAASDEYQLPQRTPSVATVRRCRGCGAILTGPELLNADEDVHEHDHHHDSHLGSSDLNTRAGGQPAPNAQPAAATALGVVGVGSISCDNRHESHLRDDPAGPEVSRPLRRGASRFANSRAFQTAAWDWCVNCRREVAPNPPDPIGVEDTTALLESEHDGAVEPRRVVDAADAAALAAGAGAGAAADADDRRFPPGGYADAMGAGHRVGAASRALQEENEGGNATAGAAGAAADGPEAGPAHAQTQAPAPAAAPAAAPAVASTAVATPGGHFNDAVVDPWKPEVTEGGAWHEPGALPPLAVREKRPFPPYPAPKSFQLATLYQRQMRSFARDSAMLIEWFSEYLFIALLASTLWFQLGTDTAGARNRFGFLFFIVVSSSFAGLTIGTSTLDRDRPVVWREEDAGAYPPSIYALARTSMDALVMLGMVAISVFIYYYAIGLKASGIFVHLGVIYLTSLTSYFFGLMAMSLALELGVGMGIAITFLIILVLLSGTVALDVPWWWRWVQYINYIRYANAQLVNTEFTNMIIDCPVPGTCQFTTGEEFMSFNRVPRIGWVATYAIIMGTGALFYVVFVVALTRKRFGLDR